MNVFARITFLVALLFSAFALAQTTSSVGIGPNTTVCTNYLRNNTAQGAVPGTPGTLPNFWGGGNAQGLAINVIGTGTENNIVYVDLEYVGTPTGSGSVFQPFMEGTQQISALPGQTWTGSAFVRMIGGSLTNVSSVGLVLFERSSGGGLAGSNTFIFPTVSAPSISSNRGTLSWVLSDAATAFITMSIAPAVTIGNPVDLTLRIGEPQLQTGSLATLPAIATTNAAVSAYCR